MMHNIRVAICAAAVAGCASTPPNYTPLADGSANQVTRVNDESGKTYLLSAAPRSRVALEHADFAYEGATFNIKVASEHPNLVTFGPADITVSQGGEKRTVLGKAEIDKAIEAKNARAQRTQSIQEGLTMLQGVLAMAMPMGSAYSGLAAQQVATSQQGLAMTRASTEQTTADSKALSGAVGKSHLDNATIPPGDTVGGLVTVSDATADAPLEFLVKVGAEEHRIRFNVSRK